MVDVLEKLAILANKDGRVKLINILRLYDDKDCLETLANFVWEKTDSETTFLIGYGEDSSRLVNLVGSKYGLGKLVLPVALPLEESRQRIKKKVSLGQKVCVFDNILDEARIMRVKSIIYPLREIVGYVMIVSENKYDKGWLGVPVKTIYTEREISRTFAPVQEDNSDPVKSTVKTPRA